MSKKKVLKKFYRAYLEWVVLGAKKSHAIFKRDEGLCVNLSRWLAGQPTSAVEDEELENYQTELFRKAGLDATYPFNNGSGDEFYAEYKMYQNQARLRWVLDHV